MFQMHAFNSIILVVGILFAFAGTILAMRIFSNKLPHDQGRAFAVDGSLSKGKVRGVGLLFVTVFVVADLLFNNLSVERTVYLFVIFACMLTGYFDDASEKPWNEYLKGALDFVLAIIVAVTYLYFNGNSFEIAVLGGKELQLPYLLYGILIVVLVWTAINVTNCTDGVDGLSATLSVITLGSFYLFMNKSIAIGTESYTVLLFMTVLVAYLWYNATPSTMLMGDAGSRAMGMMIAVTALLSHNPLLYIPFSLVMIFDGGLGLVKVSVIRFLKIKSFLKNVRCPLHDQARKVNEWSNTQVVFRFAIIQIIVSVLFVAFINWK